MIEMLDYIKTKIFRLFQKKHYYIVNFREERYDGSESVLVSRILMFYGRPKLGDIKDIIMRSYNINNLTLTEVVKITKKQYHNSNLIEVNNNY